jgi:CRP-like cAMP-binding protein
MTQQKTYLPLLDIKNILPILNKIDIFAGFSDKQLNFIFKLLKRVFYKADEYVFKQGDEPSHIYIVRSGLIKIVVGPEDEPLELIALGVGKCFGETSVIAIEPHSASAVAIEDTELIVLSRKALLSIFDKDKELFSLLILNIAREACRRLHRTDEVLLHYFLKK